MGLSTAGSSNAPVQSKARYVWRAAGYFVALAVITLIVFRLLFPAVSSLAPRLAVPLIEAFYLVAILVLTWGFCRVDQSSISALGLRRQRWVSSLLLGLGLGMSLMLLVFVIELAAGWLVVEDISWQTFLVVLAASAAASAFTEEITFRGYIMQSLAKAWGMPAAVIASSVLFGMVHMLNPHIGILGFLTICVAGIVFACSYLVTRSLWAPVGFHVGWNVTLFHLVGLPGSGYTEPSIIQSTVSGPDFFTGGDFGPEGGLLGLGALLLGLVILLIGHGMTLAKERRDNKTTTEVER